MNPQIWCPMKISTVVYFLNVNILLSKMDCKLCSNRVLLCFIPVLSRAPNIILPVCTNSLSYFQSCILHNAPWKIMLTQTQSGTFLLIHLFYRLCYCAMTLYNLASFHLPRLNFIAFPNPLSFDVLSLPICSLNFKILYLSSSFFLFI